MDAKEFYVLRCFAMLLLNYKERIYMPIYEYECDHCHKISEDIQNVNKKKKMIRCPCGHMAIGIISQHGAVHPDGDVLWLDSARKTLQPDYERPITTRSEYKRYLKEHHLECRG